MQQRLTHQMEIQEAYLATHAVGEKVELLLTQLPSLPMMLRTEMAVQITSICDFYVTAIYHHTAKIAIFGTSAKKSGFI